jgi:hypothetical protein
VAGISDDARRPPRPRGENTCMTHNELDDLKNPIAVNDIV